MKKSRYTEEQIIGILKQHEAGVKTADLCREQGISAATLNCAKLVKLLAPITKVFLMIQNDIHPKKVGALSPST